MPFLVVALIAGGGGRRTFQIRSVAAFAGFGLLEPFHVHEPMLLLGVADGIVFVFFDYLNAGLRRLPLRLLALDLLSLRLRTLRLLTTTAADEDGYQEQHQNQKEQRENGYARVNHVASNLHTAKLQS
jgi:hypothetical protein